MSEFLSDRSHSQIPLFPPPFLCLPRRSSNWRKRKSVAGAKFDNIKCSLQGAEEGWLGDFHAAEVVCSPRSPPGCWQLRQSSGEEEQDGEIRGGNLEREKGGNERTREEEEGRELSQFRISISLWQRKKRMQQQGASLLKFKAKNGISRRPLAHFIWQGRMFGSLDFPFCEKRGRRIPSAGSAKFRSRSIRNSRFGLAGRQAGRKGGWRSRFISSAFFLWRPFFFWFWE